MYDRTAIERVEDGVLAPCAMRSARSRGRRFPEQKDPFRTEFDRDRDRIVHCNAYRRLQFKTQVLSSDSGDHNRNRLTHTLDVAQIARSVAQGIGLNPALTEAVAMAHDLGHTPGGHAGEEAMDDLMRGHGGFDHNLNSLRVVDRLERRYPAFDGLNLTFEVREGIAKHNTPYDRPPNADGFRDPGNPLLEAQVADCADEIAYGSHDVDDGLREGLISADDLRGTALWRVVEHGVRAKHGPVDGDMLRYRAVSGIISVLTSDLIRSTCDAISANGIASPDDVRAFPSRLAGLSPEIAEMRTELHDFLMRNVYCSPTVLRTKERASAVIRDLFAAYVADPGLLPENYRRRADEDGLHRTVCDYVAGMTDRFALDRHRELTGTP